MIFGFRQLQLFFRIGVEYAKQLATTIFIIRSTLIKVTRIISRLPLTLLIENTVGGRLLYIIVYADLVHRKVHLLVPVEASQAIFILFDFVGVDENGDNDNEIVDKVCPLENHDSFWPSYTKDLNYYPNNQGL